MNSIKPHSEIPSTFFLFECFSVQYKDMVKWFSGRHKESLEILEIPNTTHRLVLQVRNLDLLTQRNTPGCEL